MAEYDAVDEWDVVESIYPDYVSRDVGKRLVTFAIPIQLHAIHALVYSDAEDSSASTRVAVLPPILLGIHLPAEYPMTRPPELLSIQSLHSWLPSNHGLKERLLALWQKGESVLCLWIEYIESATFLDDLAIRDAEHLSIRLPSSSLDLKTHLKAWNAKESASAAARATIDCSLCLTPRKGADCVALICTHAFCRDCLAKLWRLHMAEGDVRRIGCPDLECMKCKRPLEESELRRVLADKEVEQWKRTKARLELEADPNTVPCPMLVCQNLVPGPKVALDVEPNKMDYLRTCSACRYTFCARCLHAWHGPVQGCFDNSFDLIITQYAALSPDDPKRRFLEQKHGADALANANARREEDTANAQWFAKHTKRCPGCNAPVEKVEDSCNSLRCTQCDTLFCFFCAKVIPSYWDTGIEEHTHFYTKGCEWEEWCPYR